MSLPNPDPYSSPEPVSTFLQEPLPNSPTSPISPLRSIGRSISQSLNTSLSALRLAPLPNYAIPDLEISNVSSYFPANYDIEYADDESEFSDYCDRDENVDDEHGDQVELSADVGTILEDDENWTPPHLRRNASSPFQWRTVPPRKPVPLRRSPTSLHRSVTSLNRIKTSLNRSRTALSRNESVRAFDEVEDPNLVTWRSDDDPRNPLNWSKQNKWVATILVSSYTFISPIASTMVAPALENIADDFDIQTDIEKVLVMSIFLLAYAVGPFVIGPLSEVFGRVVVLQSANAFFLLFNFACGFAKTKEQMMAFRFLSGLGGSAPQALSIGGGVLSDCWRAEERGSALAIYSLAPFLGPAVGPIAGGYITQYTTWRWVFWATSIADLLVQLLAFLFLKETYHSAILAKICKELQQQTGNRQLHTKWQGPDKTMRKLLQKAMVRPFIMLFTQPALQAMALYRAYGYGIMYLVLSTFPLVFEERYDMEPGPASLNYISLGVGFVLGLQISGPLQDKLYKYQKIHAIDPTTRLLTLYRNLRHPATDIEQENQQQQQPLTKSSPLPSQRLQRRPTKFDPAQGIPEHRLPLCLPFGLLIPLGLVIYGWAAQARTHFIVANIGAAIFSVGLIITFNCAQAYVVDSYTSHAAGTNYAASATGAAAFVRTMAGFGFPLFAPRMYAVLGVGGGNSVLAAGAAVVGVLAPVLLWRWGGWLRAKSPYCST